MLLHSIVLLLGAEMRIRHFHGPFFHNKEDFTAAIFSQKRFHFFETIPLIRDEVLRR